MKQDDPLGENGHDSPRPDPYVIESVWRACDVLAAFQSPNELLRLSDIAKRTGLSPATAFRFVHTLERRGLLERVGPHRLRLSIWRTKSRKYRLGYAGESQEFAFARDVADSLARAAEEEGVELLMLDNRYSPTVALRNVQIFIRERVDLVIEFQAYERVAAAISSKLMAARIPLIAVDIPHPGGTYFGADNYGAGLLGGRYLARWVRQRWTEPVDEIILLELPSAGGLPNARLEGVLAGLQEILGPLDHVRVVRLDGRGQFGASYEVVRRHLRHSRARRCLVAAINDPSAVGAIRAFEESGRVHECAVLGQNASLEGRMEMRRPSSPLIGSVAYFPERYGPAILRLALQILQGKPTPPAVFIKHQMITPANLDRYYHNDRLLLASSRVP